MVVKHQLLRAYKPSFRIHPRYIRRCAIHDRPTVPFLTRLISIFRAGVTFCHCIFQFHLHGQMCFVRVRIEEN